MYDLTNFTLQDMTQCGTSLRQLGIQATSMEEVAQQAVRYLYQNFIDPTTQTNACALVRFFKTHPYSELPSQLTQITDVLLGNHLASPSLKCLTLLATVGHEPQWNSRFTSNNHQSIPLVSQHLVKQAPMISQLIQQFGLEISTVLEPNSNLMLDWEQKTYNTFFIPQALGSNYIPEQKEFVIPYNIQSVLGFGAMLPSGNLFAVIMFSKVKISQQTATLFQTLATNLKLSVLPFDKNRTFTLINPKTKGVFED